MYRINSVCRKEQTKLCTDIVGGTNCQLNTICLSQAPRDWQSKTETNLQIFLGIPVIGLEQRHKILFRYPCAVGVDQNVKSARRPFLH